MYSHFKLLVSDYHHCEMMPIVDQADTGQTELNKNTIQYAHTITMIAVIVNEYCFVAIEMHNFIYV